MQANECRETPVWLSRKGCVGREPKMRLSPAEIVRVGGVHGVHGVHGVLIRGQLGAPSQTLGAYLIADS